MNFLCIEDCDSSTQITYPTDRIYNYKKGVMYDYAYSCYGKGPIKKVSDNRYLGYATDEFIRQYFIPEYEMNRILIEVEEMCNKILNL